MEYGILTPAEKKRDAERRTEERRARERRKAERTATERTRERKRWWEGAEHRFGRSGVDAGESAPRPPPRRRNRRYGTDYSCSSDERYAPNDPATRSEREDVGHIAFKADNPGLCAGVRSDQDERTATAEERGVGADRL